MRPQQQKTENDKRRAKTKDKPEAQTDQAANERLKADTGQLDSLGDLSDPAKTCHGRDITCHCRPCIVPFDQNTRYATSDTANWTQQDKEGYVDAKYIKLFHDHQSVLWSDLQPCVCACVCVCERLCVRVNECARVCICVSECARLTRPQFADERWCTH